MIFNSITFLLFLSSVVLLYWTLPRQPRLLLIFISSLIFYGFWKFEFIFVMLFSVVVDFFLAKKIYVSKNIKFLYLSIFINLSLLFYFKYLIFFANSSIGFLNLFGLEVDLIFLKIILPLGISFYTFQTISYVVDVYRGFIKPEKNFLLYSSYVIFFPQLIAGPILRASEVIHQLRDRSVFSLSQFSNGLRRIIYGLFLKVVLADNISTFVDSGFNIPIEDIGAWDVLTLSFLFGFQIYFDFSAYSHIAIGAALLMGITFPENFNFPYSATSPRDFWKRWHISLSSWIRDYLYLPLTGSSVVNRSTGGIVEKTPENSDRALFYSWAIMGLWHGANWTFVLWGLYHAFFVFLQRILTSSKSLIFKNRIITFIGTLFTLPIMMLGWIPFRSENLETAIMMWGKLFSLNNYLFLSMRENVYLVTFCLLICFYLVYFIKEKLSKLMIVKNSEIFILSVMLVLIFIFLRPIDQFIYFQF